MAYTPRQNRGQPIVWITIRTFTTFPPHFLVAEPFDGNVAQVLVGCVIPLLLQRLVQGTDVRTF